MTRPRRYRFRDGDVSVFPIKFPGDDAMDELLRLIDQLTHEWLAIEEPTMSWAERHMLPKIERALITDHDSLTSYLATKLAAAGVTIKTP